MKRLVSLILVGLLVFSAVPAFGASNYATENPVILGQGYGSVGTTPPTKIVKVRYGRAGADDPKLNSGDLVAWDTTSADGITVSAVVTSYDMTFAGVLVTPLLTAETVTVNSAQRNWGYICVEGFCLASGDTVTPNAGSTTAGNALEVNYIEGGRAVFSTINAGNMSLDVGCMLAVPSGAGVPCPVWLRM